MTERLFAGTYVAFTAYILFLPRDVVTGQSLSSARKTNPYLEILPEQCLYAVIPIDRKWQIHQNFRHFRRLPAILASNYNLIRGP